MPSCKNSIGSDKRASANLRGAVGCSIEDDHCRRDRVSRGDRLAIYDRGSRFDKIMRCRNRGNSRCDTDGRNRTGKKMFYPHVDNV